MPITVPNLDDRTAEQIYSEALARIPVHTPEWTNFNDSDPGVTLLQLFAFMTENLLYRSNRLPEAHRLKFLSLIGIPLNPASPGYGLIVFQNERGPVRALAIDEGLELFAGKVPFRTRTPVNILPLSAEVFYKQRFSATTDDEKAAASQADTVYAPVLNGQTGVHYRSIHSESPQADVPLPDIDLRSAVSGPQDGALWVALVAPKKVPVEAARAAIGGESLSLGIYPSIQIDTRALQPSTLDQVTITDPGLIFELVTPDPATASPRARRLTVEYAEDVLDLPGIVQIRLPASEHLTRWDFDPLEEGTGQYPPLVEDREISQRIITWLRISAPTDADPEDQRPARLSWIGANVARVIQALEVPQERIGMGTGTPNQVFKLANTPVIVERPAAIGSPEPEPTLRLEVVHNQLDDRIWHRIDDLNTAGPEDQVFALDPEAGTIRCGDGLRGKRFPYGSILRASYEYGGGSQGELAIGALNKAPALPGGIKVMNPVPTWGASDGESLSDAERKISAFLRHRDRLVTASDFEDIARQTPGVSIGRVETLPLYDPNLHSDLLAANPEAEPAISPGVVTVMAVQDHPVEQTIAPQSSHLFRSAIRAWLEPRRLITTEVYVREPLWVELVVSVGIRLRAGQISAIVRRDVGKALRRYLSPLVGGIPAEDQELGEGFPLNSELREEDLFAVVSRTSGVRYVQELKLAVVRNGSADLKTTLSFHGIQLPWLINLSVQEGPAIDPQELVNDIIDPDPAGVPVPVTPRECD